jgi:predicted tellurium resistance membrane protein TerC
MLELWPLAASAAAGIDSLFSAQAIMALVTLTALEIVLGIDNVVFIAILAGKLPPDQQEKARKVGLMLALVMRIALLLAIGWIMGLTANLFYIPAFWTGQDGDYHGISGRDLILFIGGLFLIGKATHEIHNKLEGAEHDASATPKIQAAFGAIIVQIMLLDIVFSLDSVITAVGMVQTAPEHKWIGLSVMITAVVISIGFMLAFAGRISGFIERHPTMKVLALSFLLLIGVMLVGEAFDAHIPKGYIYFSMAFAIGVEVINMRVRKVATPPVRLHQTYVADPAAPTS